MTLLQAREMTKIIILSVLTFVILFDYWMEWKYGKEASVSSVLSLFMRQYPWFSFLSGFLCGHWFWR